MKIFDPEQAKRELEKRKSERDRIGGKLESLYEEIKKLGFDFNNVDEELDALEQKIVDAEKKRDKKIVLWRKKYGHFLQEMED